MTDPPLPGERLPRIDPEDTPAPMQHRPRGGAAPGRPVALQGDTAPAVRRAPAAPP